MPSGADLEYARLLARSGQSSVAGLDGSRLSQLDDLRVNLDAVGRRTVVFGDSYSAMCRSTSGTQGSYGFIKYNPSNGYFTWLNALSGQQFNVVNYAGVTGQTTAQVLSRFDSDVAAYNPEWVFLASPGVNDVSGGVSTAVVLDNLSKILDACNFIGARVVALGMPPRTGLSAGQLATHYAINNFLRTRSYTNKGFIYVEIASVLGTGASDNNWINPNATNPLDITADGIHLAHKGAFRVGKKVWDAIKNYFSLVESQAFGNAEPLNYATNPQITAGGGTNLDGATGTVASGWYVRNSGSGAMPGTVTTSLAPATEVDPTDYYGPQWQKVVNTVTASSFRINIPAKSSYTDFVPGDTLHGSLEVAFGSDITTYTASGLRCGFFNGSFQNVWGSDLDNGTSHVFPTDTGIVKVKLKTPPVTILSGLSGIYLDFVFAGLGTVYVRRPEIRRNSAIHV